MGVWPWKSGTFSPHRVGPPALRFRQDGREAGPHLREKGGRAWLIAAVAINVGLMIKPWPFARSRPGSDAPSGHSSGLSASS